MTPPLYLWMSNYGQVEAYDSWDNYLASFGTQRYYELYNGQTYTAWMADGDILYHGDYLMS